MSLDRRWPVLLTHLKEQDGGVCRQRGKGRARDRS